MKPAPAIILIALLLITVAGTIIFFTGGKKNTHPSSVGPESKTTVKREWLAPDTSLIPLTTEGDLIRFGRKLIANTSFYFGPAGIINHQANGMNCQNCHLDAGTRIFSNSFAAVASLYPQFRPRSGRIESIEFRVNECLERSLNGKKIDSNGMEMKSMVAYLKWVGKEVQKGSKPRGANTEELPFLNRQADTLKGSLIFQFKCQLCHGPDGQGVLAADKKSYTYPPLWGKHSYNTAAGLYRLTKLAGFIKYSMPFGTKYPTPQLTDEQIWDVAGFINSKQRPVKFFKYDWPALAAKPVDYPYGPYTDSFSERQHKFGPFGPIKKAKESSQKKT
jgi:thiosulfate dehydrogenase